MMLDDLYQEVLLDHFRKPRCHGCVENAGGQATLFNPLCGDRIELTLNVTDGKISDLAFTGRGCSISQASASMMAELCKDKDLNAVRALDAAFHAMMRGERTADQLPELGDATALEGVRKFSARVKCAMLAWEALEKCIDAAEQKSLASANAAPKSN